ncbi:MAG: NAD(P)H-dependent oxidoreductase [Burkholderiaceae bacterium]|nr:NAD(P)H-dependent oxidoreductase [Burkholderiaceae bacterium]
MQARPLRIALHIGSLRRAAWSRRIAEELIGVSPPALQLQPVPIGELPLYNADLETDTPPPAWTAYRDQVAGSDALLFVTPEYNRSMPGALKNAIDVASRPYGKNVYNGKPAAIVSLSTGPLGGVAANHDVRRSLVTLNAASMAHPEMFLSQVNKLFEGPDGAGALNPGTREFLAKFLAAFDTWARRFVC